MITQPKAIELLLTIFRPEHIGMWLATYPSDHEFKDKEEVFSEFITYINQL